MVRGRSAHEGVPSLREVIRAPVFLPVFLAFSLSTWGDYIARITIAGLVFQWTGSALATAAALAASLVPSVIGRVLLSPINDRMPYKRVMLASFVVRGFWLVALIVAAGTTRSVPLVLTLLFCLELFGGPMPAAAQMMLADLFPDRRLYARAFGLTTLANQVNQAVGLAVGGALVTLLGVGRALVLDLLTFAIAAVVVWVALPLPAVRSTHRSGLSGFATDLTVAWRYVGAHRVPAFLLLLSLLSALAIAAPEALAVPYASSHSPAAAWGGLLMSSPILGAVAGLLLLGRLPAARQSSLMLPMALLMPLPLLVTVLEPPLVVVWTAWFVSGALQSFMLPLQSTFTLLIPVAMRGRVFGLAGALSVGTTGVFFLVAGWVAQVTTPAAAVGLCAVITLGALLPLALAWPKRELRAAVQDTFDTPQAGVADPPPRPSPRPSHRGGRHRRTPGG